MQRLLVGLTVFLLALVVPTAAQAQRGGGGRGGGGGGDRGGYGGYGGFGYGRGFYGYGYGYGFGGLYLGYPYGGYDDSYPLYAPAYTPPPSSALYLNGSSPYALVPSEGRPAYKGASDQSNAVLPPAPAPVGNTANIRVLLPDPNAKVLVDDTPTVSTGPIRTLATPELTPGQTFHYSLTILVDDGIRTISEKRRIEVTAGHTTVVDFTRPRRNSSRKGLSLPAGKEGTAIHWRTGRAAGTRGSCLFSTPVELCNSFHPAFTVLSPHLVFNSGRGLALAAMAEGAITSHRCDFRPFAANSHGRESAPSRSGSRMS